jgi:hypothetical protein
MTFSDILYVLLFHALLKINYRIEATSFDVILGCNVKSKPVDSLGLFIRGETNIVFIKRICR